MVSTKPLPSRWKVRPGPKVDEPTRPITLTLDEKTIGMLKAVGEGNISRGVRIGARLAYDEYQKTP